jgi:hypothetical protein
VLNLTFEGDGTSVDDPAVQFSGGGRMARYRIPAGSTQAVFDQPLTVSTGTVAGLITVRTQLFAGGVDVTPSALATRTIRVARSAPVILGVRVIRGTGGFSVEITGYSTTREVSQATFRFTPASGATLQTTEVTANVAQTFGTYYGSAASAAFGSQFVLTMPFTLQQGEAATIAGVSVTLTNSVGPSTSVSAPF